MKIKDLYKFKPFNIIFILFLLIVPLFIIEYIFKHLVLLKLYNLIYEIPFWIFSTTVFIGIVGFSILYYVSRKIYNKNFQSSTTLNILECIYSPLIMICKAFKKNNPNLIKNIFSFFIINFILSNVVYILIAKLIPINLSIGTLLLFCSIATLIGFITFVPIGLFTFDISLFVLLHLSSVANNAAFLSIILFRFTYYLIPNLLLGFYTLTKKWRGLNSSYNKLPELILAKVSLFILRFMVFTSGVLLLLLTAFPKLLFKIPEIYFLTNATILHFSKTLVVIVGFLLIIMSSLLKYRTKSVYFFTLIFLVFGILSVFSRAHNYIAIGYLLIIGLILINCLLTRDFSHEYA